jgi:periodic tryptophan protein 2
MSHITISLPILFTISPCRCKHYDPSMRAPCCGGLQLPAFENVHMLSVSREAITAVTISQRGDWVALGCAALGQLLVWEWRSESYVLKQQGHHYDVSALAFSPDGSYIATGADDNKVQKPCHAYNTAICTSIARGSPVTPTLQSPHNACTLYKGTDRGY